MPNNTDDINEAVEALYANMKIANIMNNKPISIWRFEDAPPEYQELSSHGGDEDWVVHCTKEARNCYLPGGLEHVFNGYDHEDVEDRAIGYVDGWGHVCRRELDNGDIVVIFAHA